ncbi:RcpC/CpaB family pilus assembly protein [Hoyosella altamirensis]|uniref:Flp pilus assembly protein CpaB n=1 Tax=Hoyosella altamirensis TaxID=616997 RepID=A0A839RHL8_9ACTN|nr:RcpC/CpaB family pilus assembly protein [Hoyosella altamirensis]MBB3035877.1 Flp pilus assembly protein CpaB [Hoyosella altamirensis]
MGNEFAPHLRDQVTECAERIRRHSALLRRVSAGLLVIAAFVAAIAPGRDAGVEVVVVTRDLAAGSELTDDDIELTLVTSAQRPQSALVRADQAVGQRVATPVRAGELLTDARVLTPQLIDEILGARQSRGVPVRLADSSVAGLLRAGDRVDVLSHPAGSPLEPERATSVVTEDAVVLFVTEESPGHEALVILGLPPDEAVAVAGASLRGAVTVTLR